jgi:hypothetical protein
MTISKREREGGEGMRRKKIVAAALVGIATIAALALYRRRA